MHRKTLLVGSVPARGPQEAMTEALTEVGAHLDQMPDGETGDRANWVAGLIDRLRSHPDLRVRRAGDWSDYEHIPALAVRAGHRFRGIDLDLGHLQAYRASRPVFDRLRAEHGRPQLRFQVGIPGDFDLALFAFGPSGPFRHRRAFTQASVREITDIHALAGDEVVFQLEVPAELVFVTKAPATMRPAMATWMATAVTRVARQAPPGARFGVHLCLGDLGHQALSSPPDTAPVVALANAVARAWPGGRALEYLHAPLAAGDHPAPLAEAFYAPLARLRLPDSTRFVAGFLHEARSLDQLRHTLAMIESLFGGPVDIAAACGLGRRGHASATTVLRQSAALCASTASEPAHPTAEAPTSNPALPR